MAVRQVKTYLECERLLMPGPIRDADASMPGDAKLAK
jgi:hypothetical protein